MEDIILVGFGGHGKSVADCIEREKRFRIAGYTDNREKTCAYRYLGTDQELLKYYEKGIKNAAVCVGYLGRGCIREKIFEKLKGIGYALPVVKDPSAVVSSSASIEEGTFIGKGVIVNAEASIGRMAIINSMALVEHDCVLGDFCHIAVAAVLCGQVSVGRAAFVGANATVIQGMKIEPHQIVPAGAVVR